MYKIEQYKDRIASLDAETQKRFEMVKRLSENFTKTHPTAFEMDKLLAEQMEMEDEFESEEEDERSSTIPPKAGTTGEIEEKFNELFEALKHARISSPVSKEDVLAAFKETLDTTKIGYKNLDVQVQEMLSQKPVIVKYELPKKTTTPFKKPEIDSFQQIVDDIMLGSNVMLVGGAGTGKTFLAENLVAKNALGRKHITINCSQWTAPTEIIGGQTMDGYVEGKLIEAWQKGYVLILDELPKIDPNTAGLFNDALAKTRIPNAVIFNARKESFTKHDDFACIATGNIYPDKESMSYGANNKQDLSLLDRFSGSVYFIEKNPSIEKAIVQNLMIWSICNKIRSVIEELQYEAQLSLRLMENARDSFLLEVRRLGDKSKNAINPNAGKTFKSTIDNYLSTFTDVQRKNIQDKIRYREIFPHYEYREFNKEQEVY